MDDLLTKGHCNNCTYCCISDTLHTTAQTFSKHAETIYCGSYIECNPTIYLSSMIPILICITFLFICIACCIKQPTNDFPMEKYIEPLRIENENPSTVSIGNKVNTTQETDTDTKRQNTEN